MAARIIGQHKVLSRLTARINAYKRGYKIRDNRPDGVFLLVGPTGVGKTETALVLADELLGNRDAILRIDMSEYMEKYTYSRFIGAAPGYVGYNDTNQLTDKVRQNPMTIILLDEIEKADPQLLNIFLQVFDAGRLTDARGRMVDFSSTVVLMTSNVGTELYGASPLGYQEQGRNTQVGESSLLKMIRKRFSPEFLNRLDDILVFNPLGNQEARSIVDLQLEPIRRQLQRQGKELVLTAELIENLAGQGISPQYGARQLTRIITKLLLEPLAKSAEEANWPTCQRILCDWLGNGVEIVLQSDYETVLTDAGKEPAPISIEMERK
jgi:ATP-dependent Clp protease ATP-binding subunit ClpC